jgi:predicted O-linked N-acetylglucosamine transferase (SPINDLY family)
VSYFFLPLLEFHNREQFEIICYSQVHRPDEVTERIARSADGWCASTGLRDELLTDQIKQDGIDILVDLAGHTARNRLPVFTRRPAPIQVTWLGYPNTTGLEVMDYRLTDDEADPEPEADPWYSEKLVRVPNGFLCFLPPTNAPDIEPLWDIRTKSITFGSFNNLAKTNKKVIALWARILGAVPNATLILKSKALADKITQHRYLKLFARRGIDADRIVMLPATRSIAEHLGMYSQVAIGLDPVPYNGTTTTCEALYMGVPVVTLAGDRHSARVGASILTRVGLDDLITNSEEDYVRKAVELAKNPARLSRLRSTLRQKLLQSDLCNGRQFAAQIEQIYRSVWSEWCKSSKEDRHNSVRK